MPTVGHTRAECNPLNRKQGSSFPSWLLSTAELETALRRNHWNVVAAAGELGVSREHLTDGLETLGIDRPAPRLDRSRPCPRCDAAAGEPCSFARNIHPRSLHLECPIPRGEITGTRTPLADEPAAHDVLQDGPQEQVFRETMLRFASPKDRAALVRVGWMLFSYGLNIRADLEAGAGGGSPVRSALRAAARDIRHLESFLGDLCQDEEMKAEMTELAEVASRCGNEMGRIAVSIERALDSLSRPAMRSAIGPDIEGGECDLWQRQRFAGDWMISTAFAY